MNIDVYLDSAIKDIQHERLDIESFVAEVEIRGKRDELLTLVRKKLPDELYINQRSIYCSIIRLFNDRESLPVIWDLISKDETKGRRGSLVFAMENMNPIEYFEPLIELVINDNFEVLCNAMCIIDNLEGYVDGDTIESCKFRVTSALKKPMQDWRKEALNLWLEELEI